MKTFATYKTKSAHTKCAVCANESQQKSKTDTDNVYSLGIYNVYRDAQQIGISK